MGLLSSLLRGKRGGNRYERDFSTVARAAERVDRSARQSGFFGRSSRNERIEDRSKASRSERPDRLDRSDRPDRSDRSDRLDRSDHQRRDGHSAGAVRLGGSGRSSAREEATWSPAPEAERGGGSRFKTFCCWVLGLGFGAAALFGLVVGGFQLYRVATTSDFFAIRKIEIRGAMHFKREAILASAGLQEGANSLTVNIADVEKGVRKNAWVAEVAVKRRLPDAFEIRIRERAPAFWVRRDNTLYYVDNKGALIAPVEAGNFLSLPTLEVMSGGDVLLPQLDELSRAFQAAKLPVDMAGVSLFRLSAAKGFEVFIENRNLVLCIAAEDWDMNLRRLGEVLTDLARRGELKDAREVWAADGNVWVVADA